MENEALFNSLILIAEDDPDDALMLKDAFAEISQKQVTFLSNGKLLLQFIKELEIVDQLPKLVLVDLNMPLIDGRTVIKQLKKNKNTDHIPLVVLSTTRNKDDIDEVMQLGADEFFTKPSSFNDLVEITRLITKKWLIT